MPEQQDSKPEPLTETQIAWIRAAYARQPIKDSNAEFDALLREIGITPKGGRDARV